MNQLQMRTRGEEGQNFEDIISGSFPTTHSAGESAQWSVGHGRAAALLNGPFAEQKWMGDS